MPDLKNLSMQKIGIIGCGWLGYRLANFLSDNFEIYTTTTTESKVAKLNTEGFNVLIKNFDSAVATESWAALPELSSIIITVPLFTKKLAPAYLHSRIQHLLSFIAGFKGQLIVMSSIGLYDATSGVLSEESLPVNRCSGEREIREAYPEANILRLGGLMGDERFLSKYQISDLNAFVNHIYYLDICRIVQILIERRLTSKLYNVVAPMHPSKAAVVCMQKNITYVPAPDTHGKIILSSRLIEDLSFEFDYPDPRLFPFKQ